MGLGSMLLYGVALAPVVLMAGVGLLAAAGRNEPARDWRRFLLASGVAWVLSAVALGLHASLGGLASPSTPWSVGLYYQTLGGWMAVLVQFLGTVIGAFSSRYLAGESSQARFVAALSAVIAAVQLLLLANHWVWLITAWMVVGAALQPLLCFYQQRPFAQLVAHKKGLSDRLADVCLVAAAALAYHGTGSLSLSVLNQQLQAQPASVALSACAVLLVVAVALRSALLPAHGWLIQVMEAPTPVSALLHAGVVNLGGFVLIRFAPLLEAVPAARGLLVAWGVATTTLAGLVMLTRISIKVRLAWSTVAQMGFMLLECGLGMYTLAALHLIGHSVYKANAFLSASSAVQQTRLQMLAGSFKPSLLSLWVAPPTALLIVWGIQQGFAGASWPWWWTGVMALAWAPLLWLPAVPHQGVRLGLFHGLAAVGAVVLLTLLASAAHRLPLGVTDRPNAMAGGAALLGMAVMHMAVALLQGQGQRLNSWRRWSYAGFYVDEFFTRLVLRVWPGAWGANSRHAPWTASAVPMVGGR